MQHPRLRLITSVSLALALAASAGGCGETSPVGPTPPAAAAPTLPTAAQGVADAAAPVPAELAALRGATARFHDLSTAIPAGYTIENEPCVSSPAGAMGVHAPNLALLGDPTLDPERPELLLYIPASNGGYRLVGVEYFQAVLLRDLSTQEIAPRFDPTPWDPAKYEIVNPKPQLFGHEFHLSPPPVPHVPWHWALHVWVWAHNPSGLFADWNPSLRCD
jgi:hypothetical protein